MFIMLFFFIPPVIGGQFILVESTKNYRYITLRKCTVFIINVEVQVPSCSTTSYSRAYESGSFSSSQTNNVFLYTSTSMERTNRLLLALQPFCYDSLKVRWNTTCRLTALSTCSVAVHKHCANILLQSFPTLKIQRLTTYYSSKDNYY
jgi:hypothetical protein